MGVLYSEILDIYYANLDYFNFHTEINKNPKLKKIILFKNNFNNLIIETFDILIVNTSLTELNLENNHISNFDDIFDNVLNIIQH